MVRRRKVALLIEGSRRYGQDLLLGVIRYSREQGHWVFYRESVWGEDIFKRLKNWGADGIIAHVGAGEIAIRLERSGVPLILDEALPPERCSCPRFAADNKAIGQMAAEYFLERGFKNFAYIGQQSFKYYENTWSVERGIHFKNAVRQAGFDCNIFEYKLNLSKMSLVEEQSIIGGWLRCLPKPSAVLACNDDFAQKLLSIARITRIKVPDKVSILGVDNDELVCNLTEPPLSSIRLSTEKSAYEAADLLDKMMSGRKIGKRDIKITPLEILTRRSTESFAFDNQLLKNALMFIRDNARNTLSVQDVASAVSASRRKLERLFRLTLKKTILDEIQRVRTDRIADLLINTNLTIREIAAKLYYPTPSHMARRFRSEKGCTPRDYRMRYRFA